MGETCEILDIGCHLSWIFDELELFVYWIFGSIMDALGALFSLIPVPDFMSSMQSYTLPSSIAFYAGYFELEFGLGVIVSAYTIRFIIRRLPVIG